MLLRASGEISGTEVNLKAVIDPDAAAASGVPQGEALVAFAEGVVGDDGEALARARAEVLEKLGSECLVDAAAVASHFQRMVRIADSTGIPLDAPLNLLTADIRTELGIDRFGSAANTPTIGSIKRALGRLLQPRARHIFTLLATVQKLFGRS